VGLKLKADLVLIDAESGNAEKFAALVQKVAGLTLAPLILRSENPEVLKAGLEKAANRKPLVGPATTENFKAMAEIAKSKGLPLIVHGKDLESLVALSSELQAVGLNDLVLDTGTRAIGKAFEEQVMIRRAVIAAQNKALGFPTITFPCLMTDDPLKEALYASVFIAKYAGIVTLSDVPGEVLFPLLLERMNIFTDPQRPMATSPGIYEINGPTADSPVLITTNFSLTYFIVSGEVENSKLPAWLIVFNTEGLSVVTAWAAGKFAADGIAAYVKKCGIDQKVSNQRLVIPGMVAGLSGELEEELAGWKIIIGPREAQHLTPFLKELK
jgi:acetyl-CoA decarbonylase/synthase complex subunit gamma